jgi:hypothetical protein
MCWRMAFDFAERKMKKLKSIMAVSAIGAVFVAVMLLGQDKEGPPKTNPPGELEPVLNFL